LFMVVVFSMKLLDVSGGFPRQCSSLVSIVFLGELLCLSTVRCPLTHGEGQGVLSGGEGDGLWFLVSGWCTRFQLLPSCPRSLPVILRRVVV
jgi:hypothetical protein